MNKFIDFHHRSWFFILTLIQYICKLNLLSKYQNGQQIFNFWLREDLKPVFQISLTKTLGKVSWILKIPKFSKFDSPYTSGLTHQASKIYGAIFLRRFRLYILSFTFRFMFANICFEKNQNRKIHVMFITNIKWNETWNNQVLPFASLLSYITYYNIGFFPWKNYILRFT